MDAQLDFLSLTQQRDLIASGKASSREVVEHALARIARLDPRLNAFRIVLADQARAEADQRDAFLAREGRTMGPLHGVPVAIKDENDVAGTSTTFGGAASTLVRDADSEVVRLLRAAGAVIIGKTLMPEFGIWPYTESSAHGYTRNPWNPLRSTAGSSGGTAAAVASGMVAAGIGGDGGGSIRLPSSWCGLYGLKCQRGRVSTAPNPALWRSLGVLGPLTRTVADSALMYDAIQGSTPVDTWQAAPLSGSLVQALTLPFRPLRIAVSERNPSGKKADPETLAALHRTAGVLSALGHQVESCEPRYPSFSLPFMAHMAAGVADEAARVDQPDFLEQRTKSFLKVSRLLAPLDAWSTKELEKASRKILSFFDSFDLLLMPVTPGPALPVGQLDGASFRTASSRAMATSSFTSVWNICGNPAASIPSGFTPDGLPLAVQLVGPADSEQALIQVSAQLESAMPWAQHRPPVS